MIYGELVSREGRVFRPFEINVAGEIVNVFCSLQITQHFRYAPELSKECSFSALVPKDQAISELYFTVNGKGYELTVTAEKTRQIKDTTIPDNFFRISFAVDAFEPDTVLYFSYNFACVLDLVNNAVKLSLFKSPAFQESVIRTDIIIEESSGINQITTTLSDPRIYEISKQVWRFEVESFHNASEWEVEVDLYDPYTSSYYVEGDSVVIPFFTREVEVFGSKPRDFLFLVDRSASMKRFESMIAECFSELVRMFPAQSRFDVVDFGSKCKPLFSHLEHVSDESCSRFLQYVKASKCDMKRSNLIDALLSCSEELDNRKIPKVVMVITDCKVQRTEETAAKLRDLTSYAKVFVINLGTAPNFATNIRNYRASSATELQQILQRIFDSSQTPVITEPHIAKHKCQCLTTGVLTPIFFSAREVLKPKKSITISGTVDGEPFKKVLRQAKTTRQVPVAVLRDFYEMKRCNFIAPEWKLSGPFSITTYVP